MVESTAEPPEHEELPPEEYGTLTTEDADPETVDPSAVAGTASDQDDEPPAH